MSDKDRVSITLNRPYVIAIDSLIDLGVYNTRPEVILQALREFLKEEKMEPFYSDKPRVSS